MDYKKYLPAIIIGAVVIYLLMKMSKGSSTAPSVYNSLLPSGGGQLPDSRDPARVSAYSTLASVGLGQLKLQEQGRQLDSTIQLAKDKFGYQLQALGLQNEGANYRLQQELADRQYDRNLQEKALDQTFALAQSGQIGNQLGSVLSSLLSALKPSGSSARPSSGGMSGGGSPPLNPNANRPTVAQSAATARQRVSDWVARNWLAGYNAPASVTDWGYNPLGPVPGMDMGIWDWLSGYGREGFDYWQRDDPIGTVTVGGYSLYDSQSPWGYYADE